jgi:hypothetical protein
MMNEIARARKRGTTENQTWSSDSEVRQRSRQPQNANFGIERTPAIIGL